MYNKQPQTLIYFQGLCNQYCLNQIHVSVVRYLYDNCTNHTLNMNRISLVFTLKLIHTPKKYEIKLNKTEEKVLIMTS